MKLLQYEYIEKGDLVNYDKDKLRIKFPSDDWNAFVADRHKLNYLVVDIVRGRLKHEPHRVEAKLMAIDRDGHTHTLHELIVVLSVLAKAKKKD
jgi:hypothetical protein